jgi:hypothetical protein
MNMEKKKSWCSILLTHAKSLCLIVTPNQQQEVAGFLPPVQPPQETVPQLAMTHAF